MSLLMCFLLQMKSERKRGHIPIFWDVFAWNGSEMGTEKAAQTYSRKLHGKRSVYQLAVVL